RHPDQRQAPAAPHQRRARPLEDRGGSHGAVAGRLRGGGHRRHCARLAALDCGRQGRRARDRGRAESAGRLRRCQATHAVPAQSRGQCAEVHAPWPCHGGCRAAGRPAAISRVRYRYRDSRRQARRGLRRVPPGRRDDHAQFRRHRPGAQHHEEVRRDARRPDLGRERARQGLDLLLHDSASGRARGDSMSDKTVLYVEDNEFNRKIVRQLLAKTTYRLREAMDGEEGVASALATPPDLILMDIQLPRMSGLDATRQLRNDPRTAAVPIIVVTSFALSGDEPKATAAGATAYLAKPYSPRALLAKIREIVPEG